MKKLFLLLGVALFSVSAMAQEEEDSRKWVLNLGTGPQRALTAFHGADKNDDDRFDEVWAFDVSIMHQLNKNFLVGVGSGVWGKVGGPFLGNSDKYDKKYSNLIPLLAQVTVKGAGKNLKPYLTAQAGPAFNTRSSYGPNFFVFGGQAGLGIKVAKNVDFNIALDLNRALLRGNDYKDCYRHQTYIGAKAGFSITIGPKKKCAAAAAPQVIEKETIYRDVPREVEKVVERVVEVNTHDFTPVPVFFQLDKIDIQPGELVRLQAVAQMMKANPDKKFVVHGYADEVTGTSQRNTWLADHRAENVYNALLKEGVPASQLTSKVGHGGVGNMFLDNNTLSRCVVIEILK